MPNKHKHKNSQQNIRKPNSSAYYKDHTPQSRGNYPWDARMI